jgi:hypothetical protein
MADTKAPHQGVQAPDKDDSQLTEEEMRENAIRLAFDGDRKQFELFCKTLAEGIPEGTAAVLGGSSVMGHSYEGDPYDAEGEGTSDLDIYLIGMGAIDYFGITGFWIPGIHSHPLKDGDEHIAPELNPLRLRLIAIAGREVTLQASQTFYYYFRNIILGQPYLLLAGTLNKNDANVADTEL